MEKKISLAGSEGIEPSIDLPALLRLAAIGFAEGMLAGKALQAGVLPALRTALEQGHQDLNLDEGFWRPSCYRCIMALHRGRRRDRKVLPPRLYQKPLPMTSNTESLPRRGY